MTISQGGTGSGASGPAVRKIYDAIYGVGKDGDIDKKKALLPKPETELPKIDKDGTIDPARQAARRRRPRTARAEAAEARRLGREAPVPPRGRGVRNEGEQQRAAGTERGRPATRTAR